MLTLFSEIEDYYNKIPFEELNNTSDFAPLFVVKKLLPQFKKRAENVLETLDKEELKKLRRLSSVISDVGEIYRWDMKNLIEEVKKDDKYYAVQIIDKEGGEYYL